MSTELAIKACEMAGRWWAARLAPQYAEKRDAFAASVTALAMQALRGEIAWEMVEVRPGAWSHVRFAGDGKHHHRLHTEFDYDPDPLLRDALRDAIGEMTVMEQKDALPRKHALTIDLERLSLRPKEGYGNWTNDIEVRA